MQEIWHSAKKNRYYQAAYCQSSEIGGKQNE
jgi:hypothetical protein